MGHDFDRALVFGAVDLVLCWLLCDDTRKSSVPVYLGMTCHRWITQEYKLWLSQRR
jgi:hypothetical protein